MQMNAAKKVCLFLLAAIKWCAQGDAWINHTSERYFSELWSLYKSK